jgi:hypothetical protein
MRATGDFKPSEVVLGMPPLTACFNKTEAECAAAMLVWYMSNTGDAWQSVTLQKLAKLMRSALDEKPIPEPVASWNRNLFFRPDFARLISDGFVSKGDNEEIVFTELGLSRLRSWVRE